VITDKSEGAFESVKFRELDEVCAAIAENPEDLVVVHGAGSFGHPQVKKYGIGDAFGVARVHISCLKLNEIFCSKLSDYGVAVIPLHPIELFRRQENELRCDIEKILEAAERGFLPVLHGDVIFCDEGFEVLSGDDIVVFLAERINASRVGFATDVEGILVGGKPVSFFNATMLEEIGGADYKADVTGGMRAKVEKLLKMRSPAEVYIFRGSGENVARFLKGEKVGTEVVR